MSKKSSRQSERIWLVWPSKSKLGATRWKVTRSQTAFNNLLNCGLGWQSEQWLNWHLWEMCKGFLYRKGNWTGRSESNLYKKVKWFLQLKMLITQLPRGFPGGSDGKESACNAGDLGLIPGWGRSPGEGNGNPLQYSCLENSVDRGVWQATVHGVVQSQTQWATDPFTFSRQDGIVLVITTDTFSQSGGIEALH